MTTTPNASPLSSPPVAFDFAALPLDQLAQTLQRIGLGLLDDSLSARLPAASSRQLSLAHARLLAAPGLQRRRSVNLRKPTERLRTRKITPLQWQSAATQYFANRLGGLPPQHLPAQFLSLLGEVAWTDLAFQHEATHKVRAYWRRHYLFARGAQPVPSLAPQTFWLLFLLSSYAVPGGFFTRLTHSPLMRWWWPGARIAQARTVLRLEAEQQVQRGAWAGFWDQWVARHAMRAWPRAARGLREPLRTALTALPLAANALDSVSAWQRPDWRTDMPGWYKFPDP